MSPQTVVLAYSGGLDTSVAIQWLKDRGLDVVTLTIDVGQPGDLAATKRKAEATGAKRAYLVDARKEFADEYIARALKANALYEGQYPLSTALARPLIGKHLVEVARREGAPFVAHGCTGKGNDQVRFDLCTTALAPELQVIAPARVWNMTREQEIEYAREKGIPVPATKSSPYSTDENLWGRSVECGVLEDPAIEPPEEAYAWTSAPAAAPDEPAYANVRFESGVPVALNGKRMDLLAIVEKLNALAGGHGVGRIDHVESRVVGIKSREVYECPAAIVLIKAHQALEALVLPRDVLDFKRSVESRYTYLIYDGLWFTPLREALDAFVDSTQDRVSGEVSVKLYKGSATVVGRTSPFSLYEHALATYAKGDAFRQEMAEGFIYVWGLPARTWAAIGEKVQQPKLVKTAKRSK
ncbi:MAG TPA: argininosuccinate synthase [Thermoplasmata archaeon]|jgi:argininosuccinate synthase|nr:argininosuccinate synthase [Thermoplasmata archaeon]